ncbi:MAG: ribosomal protein S18-alanine N-acetyltransferase [candidate division Zixibacteria bacterium]|nr:ribosomal protein S18-alanine N-acetyltransferase [candidate division Zixibacteria bacterium]
MNSASKDNEHAVSIRGMVEADISTVAKLEREIFSDAWPEQSFHEISEDSDWGGLVAEADGSIVAYACYLIVLDELHLANIAVSAAFRRKSVAKHLLEHILSMAREHKCETIILEVRPSNTDAQLFYEKYGFSLLYRRPKYYHNPIEDALVMTRTLEYPGRER